MDARRRRARSGFLARSPRTSGDERAKRARNIRSPNERFLVEYFPLGVETAKRLYVKLAELRR
jgi:hypothetical protein